MQRNADMFDGEAESFNSGTPSRPHPPQSTSEFMIVIILCILLLLFIQLLADSFSVQLGNVRQLNQK